MKLVYDENPEYDVDWPKQLPEDDRLVLHCRRLTSDERDKAVKMATGKARQRGNHIEIDSDPHRSIWFKISKSVEGWNGKDENGQPLPLTSSSLKEAVAKNGPRLEAQDYGSLEDTLLREINRKNNLSAERPDEGND